MFREGQAIVKDVVKTANEVKAIGKEVGGIFGFFKNLFVSKEQERKLEDLRPVKQAKKKTQEFDPTALYSEISKNLTAFYKAYNALKMHIADEEEKSKTVYDPNGDQTERAINRVLAMTRMEEMQVELREYMIYQVPPELKDLYTRVREMIGTVQQEQLIARRAYFRNKKKIEEEIAEKKRKEWFKVACTVAIAFVAIYLMGFMWALHRVSHGRMY